MARTARASIVSGGARNLADSLLPEIRQRIERKYARQMQSAGFWDRLLLRLRIRREVRTELRRAAPPDACYGNRQGGWTS